MPVVLCLWAALALASTGGEYPGDHLGEGELWGGGRRVLQHWLAPPHPLQPPMAAWTPSGPPSLASQPPWHPIACECGGMNGGGEGWKR